MQEKVLEMQEKYPVRKTKAQKTAFIAWLQAVLTQAGYTTAVEEGTTAGVRCKNLVVGNPETAAVTYTAHYDTPAVLPVPNFITPKNIFIYLLYQLGLVFIIFLLLGLASFFAAAVTQSMLFTSVILEVGAFAIMYLLIAGPANKNNANDNTSGVSALLQAALTLPPQEREKVAFIFFDNEEKGLLGSSFYRGKHRAFTNKMLLLNFDCVGDGDEFLFIPNKGLRKDETLCAALQNAFLPLPGQSVEVCNKGVFYPSDQAGFARGVGVASFCRNPAVGLYIGKIHTRKDTTCKPGNIEMLAVGMARLPALL